MQFRLAYFSRHQHIVSQTEHIDRLPKLAEILVVWVVASHKNKPRLRVKYPKLLEGPYEFPPL